MHMITKIRKILADTKASYYISLDHEELVLSGSRMQKKWYNGFQNCFSEIIRLVNSLIPTAGFIVIRIVPGVLIRCTTASIPLFPSLDKGIGSFFVGIVDFTIICWKRPSMTLVQEALGSIAVSDCHLRFDFLSVYHFDPDIELLVPF